MTPPELAFLHDLALTMPDGARVVEVGSWKGRSTIAICEGLGAKADPYVWAVDTFAGDPDVLAHDGPVDSDAVLETFRRNTSGYGYLELIIEDSRRAAARFDDDSLDWVFIDANHSYDSVVRDITAWASKVKPNGVISGHDFGSYGVTEAVLRSFGKVENFETIWHTRHRPRPQYVIRLRRRARNLRLKLAARR